jgi:Cof subfamily protein (haloacid dehalogenase superfamily)
MTAEERPGPAASIRLLLADVDGTLVTQEKALTTRTVAAVRALREAGVLFAVTSGRPPRGMAMLVKPLDLELPIAAFNGGLMVDPRLEVLEQRELPSVLLPRIVELLESHTLDVWIYRGADWLVRQLGGPHVEREARTVGFAPTVVDSFEEIVDGVVKVVGVSDDFDAVAAAAEAAGERFGDHVSASRSQPYYVDVTHPQANKGVVARWLSERYEIPKEQIATIGDMPNDVLMFANSGLGIAMGNADREVQRAARRVTASNDRDGFAEAVERWVLGGG